MRTTIRLTPTIIKGFCHEGRAWVSGKTLAQAWRTCPVGAWMGWWLVTHTPVQHFYVDVGFYAIASDDPHQQKLADLLRATFNADGTRRKKRQVVRHGR